VIKTLIIVSIYRDTVIFLVVECRCWWNGGGRKIREGNGQGVGRTL